MHSKEDINKALDSISGFLSSNIGFVSEGLILNQKDMGIESQDILGIISSLMGLRDEIENKVTEIRFVMDGRPTNGQEPEY